MKSITKGAVRQELIYQKAGAGGAQFELALAPAKLDTTHQQPPRYQTAESFVATLLHSYNTSAAAKIPAEKNLSLLGSDSIALPTASIQPGPINIQFLQRGMSG